MSQIAEALAKAKERTGKGVLVAPDGSAAMSPSMVERDARRRQRLWMLVLATALPLTGFVLWVKLRVDSTPSASPPAAGSAAVAPAAGPKPQADGTERPASSGSRSPGASQAAPALTPDPQTVQLVAGLAISAVLPGDPARIMLGGRVVRAGDAIEGGLVFSGVADGQLRFTDANGMVYTRRY